MNRNVIANAMKRSSELGGFYNTIAGIAREDEEISFINTISKSVRLEERYLGKEGIES